MALTISSGLDYSSLFSFGSTSTSSSSFSSGGVSLIDYNSIRNGSYYKLLKAYYANGDASDGEGKSGGTDTRSALTQTNSAAADLKSDMYDIARTGSKDIFAKKTTANEDGTTTTGYDTDKIYKAVQSFADDYNTLLESTDKVNNKSVLKTTLNMISLTTKNSNALAQVGITVGSDNKLTIDETRFKESDMSTVKSLFQSAGSYGAQISSAASSIMNYSVSAIASESGSSYSASGAYTSTDFVGSLYNSYS